MYGFGFRAYEFTNGGSAAGGNVSLFRQRELQLGMRAMRSALYPRFFVLVSGLADLLGVEVKPFVVTVLVCNCARVSVCAYSFDL